MSGAESHGRHSYLNFAPIIDFCIRRAWFVILASVLIFAGSAVYMARLESSLTRAVFFSALMTATAFGSLWFSANPGISSMGKLLALSLACTLASAALFQPALMGPLRTLTDKT